MRLSTTALPLTFIENIGGRCIFLFEVVWAMSKVSKLQLLWRYCLSVISFRQHHRVLADNSGQGFWKLNFITAVISCVLIKSQSERLLVKFRKQV